MKLKEIILLSIVFVIGLSMRLYNVGGFSLGGDEALNVIRSTWLVRGFVGLNPMHFYGFLVHNHSPAEFVLIAPFIFNGISEFMARFPFVLIGSLIPIIYYFLFRKFLSRGLVVGTMGVLTVSPILVGWSRVAMLPIMQVLWSILIIFSLFRVCQVTSNRNLLILAIIYGLSFWILVDYILIAPLVVFVSVWLCRDDFRRLLIPSGIFLIIAGLWFLPYSVIGYLEVPKTMGINYIFAKKVGPDVVANLGYYFSTYFNNIFVWPFLIGVALGFVKKSVRENIIYKLSLSYIILNLIFYFFVYGTRAAYLYVIYFPIVCSGCIGLWTFIPRRLFFAIISAFVAIFLFLSLVALSAGKSPFGSIWGFGERDYVIEASEAIRKCTMPNDLVISDLDGFKTSLYFNRKYPSIIDRTGLNNNLKLYPKEVAAVYLINDKPNLLTISDSGKRLVYPDGSALYLSACQATDMSTNRNEFYEKFWKLDSAIDFYR